MFRRYISPDEKISVLSSYMRGLEKTMTDIADHDKNDLLYIFVPTFSKIVAMSVKFWQDFESLKAEQNSGKTPIARTILEFGRIAVSPSQDYFVFGDEYARLLKKEIGHLKKRSSPFLRDFELPDEVHEEDWEFSIEKSAESLIEGFYMPNESDSVSTGKSEDRSKLKAKQELGVKPKFF